MIPDCICGPIIVISLESDEGSLAGTANRPALPNGRISHVVQTNLQAGVTRSLVLLREQSCYNVSKAGAVKLGKSLGAEWAKYNVRVNMISLG
ncbi:hypothetical protein DSL72_000666 [Monilinia vaccinii-corymbosi]|uniref:Uncharacterized protein n=1 Tax=Monilinia vaccinii-corymbosi TaxID=61207 RepID=A0A8A3NZM3_9HELO|nr:hypothetical protein DSL72_000666 [Monilinia vaccinii-corymbosi]